jgi:hypothetical protein
MGSKVWSYASRDWWTSGPTRMACGAVQPGGGPTGSRTGTPTSRSASLVLPGLDRSGPGWFPGLGLADRGQLQRQVTIALWPPGTWTAALTRRRGIRAGPVALGRGSCPAQASSAGPGTNSSKGHVVELEGSGTGEVPVRGEYRQSVPRDPHRTIEQRVGQSCAPLIRAHTLRSRRGSTTRRVLRVIAVLRRSWHVPSGGRCVRTSGRAFVRRADCRHER